MGAPLQSRWMRSGIALAAVAALGVACASPDRHTVHWPNGKKRAEGEIIEGRREGRWTYWYQFGQKMEEGQYLANRKTGRWTRWHPNGRIQWISHYQRGKRHGAFAVYLRDGSLAEEGEFVDGKRHGMWTKYYPLDKGKDEILYEHGVEVARNGRPTRPPPRRRGD